MSFSCTAILARGAKSRSTMRWPCSCRIRLSAKPPPMASRTLAMSAPPLAHSSNASATAPMVMPTIIWLASLASSPEPAGPTWVARPNTWNTGAARSKSAGSPPTMMASVPFSAPTVPPETGASSCATPRSASRAAWSRASRGWIDAMSMNSVPRCIASAAPWRNSTSSITGPFSSMHTTISAPRTASAGLPCTCAPKAASGSALARLRFQACTACPAAHRRRAMGKPMRPVPRTAICMAVSLNAGGGAIMAAPTGARLSSGFQAGFRKARFQLAPDAIGVRGGVHGDVGPREALALVHRAHHLHVVRQAQRQSAHRDRASRRQQLAPDGVAALAIEHLARLKVALGGRDHVGVPAGRHARGFAAQGDAGHRHADFQPDQVPALVQREVAAARVGVCVVFLEAVLDVLGLRLHRHPHAHADVVGNGSAVGLQRGDHFHHALAFQHAAFALRARDEWDVFDAGGRVEEAVARNGEAGGVGHRRALDGRLGPVQEAVEHLRVETAAPGLFRREAVVAPHRLRRRLAEVRQPLVPAAGGHHREAASARPIHEIADQRGLVTERE